MASGTPLKFSRFSYMFFIVFFSVILFFDSKNNVFSSLRLIQASIVITSDLLVNQTKNFFSSVYVTQTENQKMTKEARELKDKYEALLAKNFFMESNAPSIESQSMRSNLAYAKIVNFNAYKYICCGVHEMLISKEAPLFRPVLNASGLIGQLIERQGNLGKLLLLSSSKHFLPVLIGSSYCNASGKGIPMTISCSTDVSEINETIFTGQLVYTSGLGGIFPKGLKVGDVKEITLEGDTAEIVIELAADPRISPNVYIIEEA